MVPFFPSIASVFGNYDIAGWESIRRNHMKDRTLFRQIAAITAILAAPVTLANTIVLFIAVDFNTELMSNPVGLINIGAAASEIFRWGTILELGAPTLLLVPAALYLWYWLEPRAPRLVTMYTVFGLASMLLAVTGTLLRANLYPPLMAAYPQASEAQQEILMVIFQGITDFNFEGLWALELILWGIWWLGIGLVLRRERRSLGIFTVILGTMFLIAGAGWLLRVGTLARLENAFFLVPFWTVWLGIVIWRRGEQSEQMAAAAAA
jgi:hypothetical protein